MLKYSIKYSYSYDNMFFNKGTPFNQGNIFTFKEDDFISACEVAIKKTESQKLNEPGLALQKDFSSEKFLQNILTHLK